MKRKKLFIFLSAIAFLAVFLYCQNNLIQVTHIDMKSPKIPKDFEGFKIVQISDLHSKTFGENQKYIVKKITSAGPDIIVFTGDMVNEEYNEEPLLTLIDEVKSVAPLYYVTGNHDFPSSRFQILEKKLAEKGVKVLRNRSEFVKKGEGRIAILGIDDPLGQSNGRNGIPSALKGALKSTQTGDFKVLLSHRPELIDIYAREKIDLVFSGHAHGGQFRLPFIGGVVAPNQGFNPEYYSGKYQLENTSMVVSRGLGNSIIPQRLFNRPNVVVVELMK